MNTAAIAKLFNEAVALITADGKTQIGTTKLMGDFAAYHDDGESFKSIQVRYRGENYSILLLDGEYLFDDCEEEEEELPAATEELMEIVLQEVKAIKMVW